MQTSKQDPEPSGPAAAAAARWAARRTRTEKSLAAAVLVLLLVGSMMVLRPFLSALMWAVVLCFSLWPMQRRLIGAFKGRRTLAALFTTLTIMLVLVVPFVVIGFSLADDARALSVAAKKWLAEGPPKAPRWLKKIPVVGARAEASWTEITSEITKLVHQANQTGQTQPQTTSVSEQVRETATADAAESAPAQSGSRLATVLGKVFALIRTILVRASLAIGAGAMEIALSVFLAFFILRDGDAAASRLRAVVDRIAGDRGPHLLKIAGNTVRGVVYGVIGTALVQGLMAGTGFLIAGVPGAPLLGLLTFFLSVVPMGPPMIWIPVTVWLFTQGRHGWGVFMLIWGVGISSVDNFIRPWLIGRGSAMPFILTFVGVIGGAVAFGFIGVFLGPTLLAVMYRLLMEWSRPSTTPSDPALAPTPA